MTATLTLLRRRPAFARLFLAELISLGGDWFTLVALALVVARAGEGSGLALGGLMAAQLLPMVVLGPWSGVLVDRLDRRRLLIASDLLRFLIVLGLIPAAAAQQLPLVYLLAFGHFAVTTVFEPGRAALLPSVVEDQELVAAATLSSVTWSVMAALGGLASGTLAALAGVQAAFLVDALSFLCSGLLILSIRPEQVRPPRPHAGDTLALGDGVAYLRKRPVVLATLLVKAIGGVTAIEATMALYATRLFPIGRDGALTLGLGWASFGLGAVLGPLVCNRLGDGSMQRLRRFIVAGTALIAAGLFALSVAPHVLVFAAAVLLRGAGGSANWTFSTVLLQRTVPDALRGRLFALELAAFHLSAIVFALLWGALVDRIGLRETVLLAGAVSLLPLIAWTANLSRMDRPAEPSAG
jgi:MFS family permease